jgi:hypothetical protein
MLIRDLSKLSFESFNFFYRLFYLIVMRENPIPKAFLNQIQYSETLNDILLKFDLDFL